MYVCIAGRHLHPSVEPQRGVSKPAAYNCPNTPSTLIDMLLRERLHCPKQEGICLHMYVYIYIYIHI